MGAVVDVSVGKAEGISVVDVVSVGFGELVCSVGLGVGETLGGWTVSVTVGVTGGGVGSSASKMLKSTKARTAISVTASRMMATIEPVLVFRVVGALTKGATAGN